MKQNLLLANRSRQTSLLTPPLSVSERLAKARAAKRAKRLNSPPVGVNRVKLRVIDSQVPRSKVRQGPYNEAVQVGERGGRFYRDKNGNRTYLSSNE